MQMDYTYDPWDDKKVYLLFLPNGGEHPKDAVAPRIDLLLEARTSPDGYQMVVEGGDPYGNFSELDKIKILEKCLYLIAALSMSIISTPYNECTVRDWWAIFKVKNCFPHPRGPEGNIKKSKERIPPFLAENEDLHSKFVRHCTNNLNDLSIELAKEYVTETLIPLGF
jgi:hypothetical protein